jgi:hypothetical protein
MLVHWCNEVLEENVCETRGSQAPGGAAAAESGGGGKAVEEGGEEEERYKGSASELKKALLALGVTQGLFLLLILVPLVLPACLLALAGPELRVGEGGKAVLLLLLLWWWWWW